MVWSRGGRFEVNTAIGSPVADLGEDTTTPADIFGFMKVAVVSKTTKSMYSISNV